MWRGGILAMLKAGRGADAVATATWNGLILPLLPDAWNE